MKLSIAVGCALLLARGSAFQVATPTTSINRQNQASLTQQYMFGGAGAGAAPEDDEEENQKVAQAAQAMGMTVAEYKLAMNARVQLSNTLDNTKVSSGNKDTVYVEKDLNTPPRTLEITITEAGKALGKEKLSKELVSALKKTSDDAKIGRSEAQKKMMVYIQEQMKS